MLNVIYSLTRGGDHDPRGIWFENVIEKLTPDNYFVFFGKKINGIQVYSINEDVQDPKKTDLILGRVITYLFLLDKLVKDNLIVVYLSSSQTNLADIHIKDKVGNTINDSQYKGKDMYRSKSWSSDTFWNLISSYGNMVVLPSYELINYIENDYQTVEESARNKEHQISIDGLKTAKESLDSSQKSMNLTQWALYISIAALLISSFAESWSVYLNYEDLSLSRKSIAIDSVSLIYAKKSSTDLVLNNLIKKVEILSPKQLKNELVDIKSILNNDIKDVIIRENRKLKRVELVKIQNDLRVGFLDSINNK